MSTAIYVATQGIIKTHIPEHSIYYPLQVGASGKDSIIPYAGASPYLRDDEGDNISIKNPYYCELTGHYWIWKHSHFEIIGICHYRRYFVTDRGVIKRFLRFVNTGFFTEDDIRERLKNADMLAPDMITKDGTIGETYSRAHNKSDLIAIGEAIRKLYPEYYNDFIREMNGNHFWVCNMLIARKDVFDDYCSWLFDILFHVEQFIPYQQYDNYQRRVFGFLSERLFGVWIRHNKINAKACKMITTQGRQI